MSRRRGLIPVTALALAASSMPVSAQTTDAGSGFLTFSGTATDLRTQHFLYREEHFVRLRAGETAERVVLYTCADGKPFAHKRIVYAPIPIAPEFVMENALSGHRESLTWQGGAARVSYRENRAVKEISGPMPNEPGIVADAGFDEFVKRNWRRLVTGKTLRFDFLVPSRLDYYRFKVRRLRGDTISGAPVDVFRLGLSGIWGWILPGIDVYYSSSNQSLLRYEGLSNLQNADGDNFKTRIDFPVDGTRRADGANPLAAAMNEPLVGSCAAKHQD